MKNGGATATFEARLTITGIWHCIGTFPLLCAGPGGTIIYKFHSLSNKVSVPVRDVKAFIFFLQARFDVECPAKITSCHARFDI
jgi:hypothetical protein